MDPNWPAALKTQLTKYDYPFMVVGPVCFAESHDGIEWFKPELNQINFYDSTANNAVDLPFAATFAVNPIHCVDTKCSTSTTRASANHRLKPQENAQRWLPPYQPTAFTSANLSKATSFWTLAIRKHNHTPKDNLIPLCVKPTALSMSMATPTFCARARTIQSIRLAFTGN